MGSDSKSAASLPPAPPPVPSSAVNGSNNAFPRVRPMHGRTSGPTRRSTRGQWTPEEDDILRAAVQRFKGKNWKKIAECFKDRTDVQCLHRWQKVLNPDLIKGPWSKEEDEIIVQLVKKYGPKKWSTIAQHLPGRIGKQCRERWHNHLNPAINKEAWTQEEELILIRAQSLYGNKWAELTKYLPGRTDNSIKNHWNSSVKKKLESYRASGMLAQLESLQLVCHLNQSVPAESLHVQQFSGDSNIFRDGAGTEDISECSQVGCSQTASDMSNTAAQGREDFLSEESDRGKVQTSSPTASCSEQYYTSLDDMTFTIPDIPCEFSCSSKFPNENYSQDLGSSAVRGCNFGTISLPNNPSSGMAADSSSTPGNYFFGAPDHNLGPGPSHQSIEYTAAASVNNVGTDVMPGQMQRTDEGCSQIVLSQEGGDECPVNFKRRSDIIDMERYSDYISFQTIYQFCESGGTVALQPYNSLNPCLLEASNCADFSSDPPEVPGQNGVFTSENELSRINDSLPASQGQEFVGNAQEGHVHAQNTFSSPSHDPADTGFTKQTNSLDSSRLVPVDTFCPGTSDNQQTCRPNVESPVKLTCEQEPGMLCYEPPRFPSLEIPFLSCDLAQSSSDVQPDFSPLGIRQFMMSSASNLTPFKLWDSPSSDASPDAVLKSAAKTFACTPSILKKRHRDLLSPLSPFSERRYDKKTEKDVNQGFASASRLTKELSRLDVMFDETDQSKGATSSSCNQNKDTKTSVEDKENICPISCGELGDRASKEDANTKDLNMMQKEGIPEGNPNTAFSEDCASETPRGILVERQINDVDFSSPDGIRPSAVEVESLKDTSKEVAIPESVTGNAGFFVSPQPSDDKNLNNSSAVRSAQPVSSAADSLINEVGAENLNFFGGTPFRRSIESPSAWKSPWYFSSLASCPRFDTDLTIEDIGIFMSPGDRSYDAIGLMKQINEQSADAYADALEVLGNETPESILKQRCSKNMKIVGESSQANDSQLGGCPPKTSNVLTERRVLDFSECGTPAKSMEKGKGVAASLSSPSCLLKSFR